MRAGEDLTRVLAVAIMGAVLGVLMAAPALAATETYRDEFNEGSYSGSHGTLAWPVPWTEVGESDGPGTGQVGVVSDPGCPQSPCLQIKGGDVKSGRGVGRYADLSAASGATLSLEATRVGLPSYSLVVSVSTDGANWTHLGWISTSGTYTYDLGPYLSHTTHIRILGSNKPAHSTAFLIDNVTITLSGVASTTTTTTPPTTTTTTPPTTTTTTPPTTTVANTSTTTTTTPPTTTVANTTTTTLATTTTTAEAGSDRQTEVFPPFLREPQDPSSGGGVVGFGLIPFRGEASELPASSALCCPGLNLVVSFAATFFELSARALGPPLLISVLPLLWMVLKTLRQERALERSDPQA